MNLGRMGVFYAFHGMKPGDIGPAARRIESMGYSAVWLSEFSGRYCFVLAGHILANTQALVAATGVANIYQREASAMAAAQRTLADLYQDRFLLGMGVSHAAVVEGLRGLKYGPPVATMRHYLEQMAATQFQGFGENIDAPIVLAALGPKMLELAGEKAHGAHPYFVTPEHTRQAREVLGPGRQLCVEQKIILETRPEAARAAARRVTEMYAQLPNYRNNWKRLGFTDAEIDNGGSDRFIDAFFAWGDGDAIRSRIQAHFDSGADHVCVQAINPLQPTLHWEALEEAIKGF